MKRRFTLNVKKSEIVDSQNVGTNNNETNQQQQSDKQDKVSVFESSEIKNQQQYANQNQNQSHNPQSTQQQRTNSLLICPPSFNSKLFKNNIFELLQSFNSINQFTDNLQSKVDHLLKRQQNQFVVSYHLHMQKIDQQFRKMETKTERMQQQIEYYENQGIMSTLVQKVKKIEEQNAQLLYRIEQQSKKINSSRLQNTVLKEELKRTQKRLKQFSKNKLVQLFTPKKSNQQSFEAGFQEKSFNKITNAFKEHSNLFTTEIAIGITDSEPAFEKVDTKRRILPWQIANTITKPSATHKSFQKRHKKNTDRLQSLKQLSLHKQYKTSSIQKLCNNFEQPNKGNEFTHFTKEIEKLKKKNQALVKQHSDMFERKLQMQTFLTQCIDEIKRNVRTRKKIRFCTFQDFSKQDKITLLLKVVSNQEILRHLYQKIFKQKEISG